MIDVLSVLEESDGPDTTFFLKLSIMQSNLALFQFIVNNSTKDIDWDNLWLLLEPCLLLTSLLQTKFSAMRILLQSPNFTISSLSLEKYLLAVSQVASKKQFATRNVIAGHEWPVPQLPADNIRDHVYQARRILFSLSFKYQKSLGDFVCGNQEVKKLNIVYSMVMGAWTLFQGLYDANCLLHEYDLIEVLLNVIIPMLRAKLLKREH